MKKLKVSWTILSAWSKGGTHKDEALAMIAGVQQPPNQYMIRGKRIHNIISRQRLKLIPEISDSAIFEDINPQKKQWINYFKVEVNEWLDLSLVIDVLDTENKTIVDWKTGRTRSYEQNKLQIYVYAYAMELLKIPINRGILARVDERKNDKSLYCPDYTIFHINAEKREVGEEYIISNASEIYSELY